MAYDHIGIEQKWQKYWEENKTFKTPNESSKPKKYILDMFPYPSGAGLHVGHPKGYTATDIVSRYYHATGYNVLHTMGFDAFGLPAENHAIKTGTHPSITAAQNTQVFTEQLKGLGFSYDWDRLVDTTDPEYYKWTQWIFLELFKKGLAYEQDLPINYCPSCKTGLANEEVLSDNTCDRCGTKVERRPIRQWVLKITEYADRLLSDIDTLDWPEGIKEMQRNWIGKSEGCEFEMLKKVENKPIALIFHGFGDKGGDHWATWMSKKLEAVGYEVYMPDISYDSGNIDASLAVLSGFREKMNENSLIIGHSMGSHLAMRFIESLDKKINKFIAIAPAYEKMSHEKAFKNSESLKQYELILNNLLDTQLDHAKIRKNIQTSIIVTSDDDSIIPQDEQKKHFESCNLLDEYVILPKKNHFSTSRGGITEIPEILKFFTKSISVYTTRIDTVFGMTYAVLAPDHPSVDDFITTEQRAECDTYIEGVKGKSDQDRTNEGKEKTGVWTGSYVINPYNNESVPLWIADYVLGSYGTGAVMAVPAHDERDFAFAKKYNLKVICSIEPAETFPPNSSTEDQADFFHALYYTNTVCFPRDGKLCHSGEFDGITSVEARKIFSEKAESEGFGHKKVNYKLRDWLFSRQRYWGEPIPLIHLNHEDLKQIPHIKNISEATDMSLAYILKRDAHEGEDTRGVTCGSGKVRELIIDGKVFSKIYDGITGKIIIDSRLPLTLPEVEKYEPAGDGQSPLATVPDWVNVKLADNLAGKRETNTMPQWGGSCWYYLRYMDNKNPDALASKEALNYWGMVDEYVGGAEHAVLHLLYARFWHKVLFDIGVVPHAEPFQKLTNVGMILAYAYERLDGGLVAVDLVEERDGKYFEKETGKEVKQVVAKMSKSLKNVVNPNDIVREHGADTLRLYEMSMSGFTDTAPWNPDAIIGVRRLLDKAYSMVIEGKNPAKDDMKAMKLLHKTIKKVGEDIREYKFNTAIAALQILLNEGIPVDEEFKLEWKTAFAILLHPFAPHMAEELYASLGNNNQSVYNASWPEYDEFMLVDDDVTIAIQIGGKLRGTLTFFNGVAQEEVSIAAMSDPSIAKWLEGKIVVKEIFIPNKMLSIVVKDA